MDAINACHVMFIYVNLINILVKLNEIQQCYHEYQLKVNDLLLRLLYRQHNINTALLSKERHARKRRCLKKPTYMNTGWWEQLVPQMTEDMFKEEFRINRITFNYIVSKIKQSDCFVSGIAIDKRVAIGIKVLSSTAEYKEIAKTFGIGKTTVHDCFKFFINSCMEHLVNCHIRIPSSEEFKKIAEEFEKKWNYPMAIGAIDGCHFKIQVPEELAVDYYSYKSCHSIISIAICDANYKVWYVKSGIPGRTNDSGAFQQTSIFQQFEQGTLLPCDRRNIEGCEIPYHLLGDGAFPLKSWLMKPYIFRESVDQAESNFNYRHSAARRVIENVFGLVKTRWRRTLKKMEIKLEDAAKVVQTAFALHNICEEFRDYPSSEWNEETDLMLTNSTSIHSAQSEAILIRNALKLHFQK